MVPGKNDAMDACALGSPDESAQVVGILDLVENEEEWWFASKVSGAENVVDLDVFFARCDGYDSLCVGIGRELKKPLFIELLDGHSASAGKLLDLLESAAVRPVEDADLLER
jgi:hypothetical protein